MITAALNRLYHYWFEPAHPIQLALLRISTGGFALWYLWSRFGMLREMARSGLASFEPIGLLAWMDVPLHPATFDLFLWLLIGLNIAWILGWQFRITGPAFALAMLLFFTYRNSWSMIYHNRNALILHVFILGFVGAADLLSLDRLRKGRPERHWRYGWPIKLLMAATLAAYFVSGVAKLTGDLALQWADGSALRSQIAVDAIRKSLLGSPVSPLFETIYPLTGFFLIMGIGTFVLELGAPFALLRRRWGVTWAFLTWGMHWGIFFVMGIRFRYQMTGLIFLPFFDLERLWYGRRQPLSTNPPVLLFDGECTLCNRSVQTLIRLDPDALFRLASLQSDTGRQLLREYDGPSEGRSIVLIKAGTVYTESDAVLRTLRQLPGPIRMLWGLRFIPRPWRDALYRFVARNRYRWFGKQEVCALPQATDRLRILEN